eukprot:scaffold212718_cov31-Tisochrysis_lutea.AAC.5
MAPVAPGPPSGRPCRTSCGSADSHKCARVRYAQVMVKLSPAGMPHQSLATVVSFVFATAPWPRA